jgi:hypothetical protein
MVRKESVFYEYYQVIPSQSLVVICLTSLIMNVEPRFKHHCIALVMNNMSNGRAKVYQLE